MKRSTTIFFYVLGGYVLLQFSWWAYHLIELTQVAPSKNQDVNRKVLMIISEGLVFLLIILLGIWRIRYSLKKEIQLADRQQNFLLSVTHELKTPLASNKLMLQTLLRRKLDPEQQESLLQKAISENVRLEGMIDNILNTTRIDHKSLDVHTSQFSINDLVENLITRYQKVYQLGEITLDPKGQYLVSADENMVEAILVNLLDNAFKYSSDNPQISILIYDKNKSVMLEISDNGPGIAPSMHRDIFKKFVREGNENTRNKKGSGLGLYIALEFALMNKGKLSLKKSDQKGSIFLLELAKA